MRVGTAADRSNARPARHQPLVRQTLAGAVVQALRERILDGLYPSGTQLRQEMLAAELGVSRIPIREALRQLEAEGLVTFAPHKGAVVVGFSIAEIEELFELRALLESDLIKRAVPNLTTEQLDRAESILDGFDEALAAGDVATWGDLNWRFHSAIYAAAGRPLTLATVERLHRQAERYMRMQLALTHGESRASSEHREILEACRRGNARSAATILAEHIRTAGRALAKFLAEHEAITDIQPDELRR
jgi:DNA-binding GntR family transcriptional regulator